MAGRALRSLFRVVRGACLGGLILVVSGACGSSPAGSAPARAGSLTAAHADERGTARVLRAHIDALVAGRVADELLSPDVSEFVRSAARERAEIVELGRVRDVAYIGAGPESGSDVYDVTTEHGFAEWHVTLGADGKIAMLSFRSKAKPPAVTPSEAELRAQLEQELTKLTRADRFAGAVLVTRNGETLFEGAYGLADREAGIDNAVDTKFRIASVGKMFTIVALQQLVESRKLSLDDAVGEHLTSYPSAEVATRVTLGDLLVHRGGTGDIFGAEYDAERLELKALEDYVRLYGERELAFEPGSKVEYSNYGFVLLGLVIARASGQSYYDYVRDHVFKPAGMVDTGSPLEVEAVERRSRGYTWSDGEQLVRNDDSLPPRATSAGGTLSTVADLQRFARALEGGRLLSAASLRELHEGRVNGRGQRMPGALPVAEHEGLRVYGHGGGHFGMGATLAIFPVTGHVVTVLSNLDPPAAARVNEFIVVRLPKR